MNSWIYDIRYAVRILCKTPVFTLIALCTLALGIGASTTMFGVLNAILLQPLPFYDPDQLVRIYSTKGSNIEGPSALDLRDYAGQNNSFARLTVYDTWRKNVSVSFSSVEPEQLPVGLTSADYFEILGVHPLMGRLFAESENQWGRNFEAILSYEFWQTHFSGDRSVLGKTVRINDEPYTIVGVMSNDIPDWWLEGRHGKTQLWTPFAPSPTIWNEAARGQRDFSAIGRLKPGVSIAQAGADLKRIASDLSAQYPVDQGIGVELRPLSEDRIGNLRPVVLLLTGAVALILLIACSNVANLLLAKNSSRAREVAIKLALGADRLVVMRQFIAESVVLGLLAGVIGSLIACWGCNVLARIHPSQLPQLALVKVNFGVLVFGLLLSILSSVLFGTLPAWINLQLNPSETLKEGGKVKTSSRARQQMGKALVASEMAFAVMLLIASALLVQSLLRLRNQEPGFRTDNILRSHLYLPAVHYSSPTAINNFMNQYADKVRSLPGVIDATISAACPPDDQWIQNFTIVGHPLSSLSDLPVATLNVTDSHYLQTLGVPLLNGRGFTEADTENTMPVAMVNHSFVRTYFPNEDPIGKVIQLGRSREGTGTSGDNERLTIVGVIADAMNRGVALPTQPEIVGLFRQLPDLNYGFKNLLVRTKLAPMDMSSPVRQQLRSLDANIPFAEVSTMGEIMSAQTSDRRYTTGLLVLFAFCGVLLSILGVYGVVSHSVTQRTAEIGVRIALGAQRANVLWMVVRQGMEMALIGSVVGIGVALALRHLISGLVFGISAADPTTLISASLLLLGFAGAASLIPAYRAASTDPISALRVE